ncbi:hypothetical protein OpiT1DRAFT_01226 [Opitutaceae bacterium TAV1]|nr:hypothetical protein OpiT1DRAFT_01226 [Opitutaceae bacterium TAV1]
MTNTHEENAPIPGETLDGAGVPFDPARHLPRINQKTGRWMPKSPGRARKKASSGSIPTPPPSSAETITDAPPSPPASESSGPATSETGETATASAPFSPPAGSGKTQPDFSDFEEAAAAADGDGGDSPGPGGGNAPENEGKGRGDAKSSPDDLARLATKTLYMTTGRVIGDMKAAKPPADQEKALLEMLEAFFRWRGIQVVGWLALGVGLLSYLLRDEIFAAVSAKRKGEPRNVTPRPIPPPASQPAPPPAPAAAPAAPRFTDPFL